MLYRWLLIISSTDRTVDQKAVIETGDSCAKPGRRTKTKSCESEEKNTLKTRCRMENNIKA
jgi:hypothetical protein